MLVQFAKNIEPVSSIDEINEKTFLSTGRLEYFIETFRAHSVACGHSSYKLTKSVSFFIAQLGNHSVNFIGVHMGF